MRRWIIACLLLWPATARAEDPKFQLGVDFPTVGQPVQVSVTGDLPEGAELGVIHRPTSATEETVRLGPIASGKPFEWTPADPGIATLVLYEGPEVPGEEPVVLASRTVAIRFEKTPTEGIAVMILAGLLLFGGAGISLAYALRGQPEPDAP